MGTIEIKENKTIIGIDNTIEKLEKRISNLERLERIHKNNSWRKYQKRGKKR